MRLEHARILLEFARLQLRIALARQARGDVVKGDEPGKRNILVVDVPVTEDMITSSVGFKKLRQFFARLPSRKRDKLAADWRRQMDAVYALERAAKASGETFTLADIEIETIDRETGLQFPNPDANELEGDA